LRRMNALKRAGATTAEANIDALIAALDAAD
jgi:hypothetical protein